MKTQGDQAMSAVDTKTCTTVGKTQFFQGEGMTQPFRLLAPAEESRRTHKAGNHGLSGIGTLQQM